MAVLDGLGGGRARLRGQAEEEVGGRVARDPSGEGEVAVGPVDERDLHPLAAHVRAELPGVPSGQEGQLVRELVDLVDALHERLLAVSERGGAREEALDGDRGQPHGERVRVGQVDPIGGVLEAARDLRVRVDAAQGEAGHVDRARAEGVRVRQHHVLESGLGELVHRLYCPRGHPVGMAPEIASQDRVLVAHVVVEADTGLVAIVFDVGRRGVAVAGNVRQGNEVSQELQRDRVQARGRDDVPGEGLPGAGIPDRSRRGGEVAAPLFGREHGQGRRGAADVPVALVVGEGEELVRRQRSTQRGPELVLLQLGLGLGGGREEVAGLERVAAIELPGPAVPLIGAGLGDDVDDGARVASVLRAVGVGEDLELLDRVRGRTQHEAGVEGVVVGRAVEEEVVGLVPHPVDVEAASPVAEAAGGGVAGQAAEGGRRRDHAGDEGAELREVAAVERQVDDLLLVDDDAQRAVRGLDQRRFADDGHGPGESSGMV